ncbi:hypothetical protein ACFRCG_06070 [Embleya sp. NPDC056575]
MSRKEEGLLIAAGEFGRLAPLQRDDVRQTRFKYRLLGGTVQESW